MAVRWKKIAGFSTFFAVAIGMSLGAALYIWRMEVIGFSRAPWKQGVLDVVRVEIPKGATAREIAAILEARGVVGDKELFYRYLRDVAGRTDTMKAGVYELQPDMSPQEVFAVLEAGRDRELRFTVPEGKNAREIAAILAQAGFGPREAVDAALADPALVEAFGVPAGVPGGVEGYLFPDTYQFPPGTKPDRILKRMRARLDEKIDDEMRGRMKAAGMSLHQTLTLASIVEKETGRGDERPRIAAVFLARLKKGMKLQTDPTVIYGAKDYDGDLKREHLRDPHPYNTYVHAGLPPGPIASPGEAAIRAVLWPAKTDDLFFVSRGDGSHEFCPTLACHEEAVARFQLGRE